MWFFTNAACGSPLSSLAERHGLWLVFFGLALAACDFLDGFALLRVGFLRLRAWVYGAINPTIRPLSVGDYWLISVVLLVAGLSWSVLTSDAAGAPVRFFIYATVGLAVMLRLYLVVFAVEKSRLARPPERTSDRLLARISTERAVWVGEEPARRKRRRSGAPNGLRLLLLVPLTYLWQTLLGLMSVVIWVLYSPILMITLTPGRLFGFLGVAIAAAGFWLPRTCR